jgi:hypothetical protein
MADGVKQVEIKSDCLGFGKAWAPEEDDCKECKVSFSEEYKACKNIVVNWVKEMREEAGKFASTADIETTSKKENRVGKSEGVAELGDENKQEKETKKMPKEKKVKVPKEKKVRKNGLPGVNVKALARKMIGEGADATAIKTEIVRLYTELGKTAEFATKRAKTVYGSVVRKMKKDKAAGADATATPPVPVEEPVAGTPVDPPAVA